MVEEGDGIANGVVVCNRTGTLGCRSFGLANGGLAGVLGKRIVAGVSKGPG